MAIPKILGKVTTVVDLPMGVSETLHRPAKLVKFATGNHTFLTEKSMTSRNLTLIGIGEMSQQMETK